MASTVLSPEETEKRQNFFQRALSNKYTVRVIHSMHEGRQLLEELQAHDGGIHGILIDQFFYHHPDQGAAWAEMAAKACPKAKVVLQDWGKRVPTGDVLAHDEEGQRDGDEKPVPSRADRANSLAAPYVTVRPTLDAVPELLAHFGKKNKSPSR